MSGFTVKILAALLLTSCARHDDGGTSLSIHKYQTKRDEICEAFDPSLLTKCDRSTFHVAMAAACPAMPLPTQYEFPDGKWNRDETGTCYPDESRSQTSQDTYMSLAMTQDKEAIARAYEYAVSVDWETGRPEGNAGYLTLPVRQVLEESLRLASVESIEDILEVAKRAISGFRGHLIANYLWARARQEGGLLPPAVTYLKVLHEQTPESPYLSCLYHRFSDGDQAGTLKLLDNIGTQSFGWGHDSNSWQIHYAMTVACLEGK